MNESNTQTNPQDLALIFQGLCSMQEVLQNPHKDTQGYGYKYATLEQVLAIIKPELSKRSLTLIQSPVGQITDGCLTLKTMIGDKKGQYLEFEFQIPIPQGKNVTQDFGSACTYARRYALLALFALGADDDDGRGSIPKSEKIVKITPEHKKAIEDVNAKIEKLEVRDFANGTKFIPEKVTLARLNKFLETSDDICVSMAEKWRSK